MGGFILSLNKDLSPNDISFNKRNQIESYNINTSQFSFKKYKKLLVSEDIYIHNKNEGLVIGSGTISYRGLGIEGFNKLASDILYRKLESEELFGHFTIFHFSENIIKIYFDESGYGAPFVVDNKYISSSFLSCIDNLEKINLNHDAIFEEIFTGCYFNGKTTFKEVRKITGKEEWKINDLKIQFIPVVHNISYNDNLNKNNTTDYVLNDLRLYFERWSLLIDDYLGDLGLSSGYDSRLILGLMEEKFKDKYQVHSYWKKNRDFDNIIADNLAKIICNDLIRIPIKDRSYLSVKDFDKLIDEAMLYYDGLFPVNHGWVREYRTSSHRTKILNNSRFGFSGISGEQYRNDYNLLNKSFSINYLIKNIILEDNNDEILYKSNFNNKGYEIIRRSLTNSLNLNKNSKKISRLDIQRYYCEMWVPGGPGIRNRIENYLTFFLSPFSESRNQKIAYRLIDNLGYGGEFQAEMIVKANKKMSSVRSDYGFSFDQIKYRNKILWFISAFLGRKNKMKLVSYLKPKPINYFDSFGVHKDSVKNKLEYLKKYNFEFPIESPNFKQDTIDRQIALSTLLKKYESKIEN